MNKKGFTLIELIAVIVLIAIISIIAVTNIVQLIDRSEKEEFVTDAKTLISKAKYRNALDAYQSLFTTYTTSTNCKEITAFNLGFNKENDPDGNTYDLTNSGVLICDETVYYVKTWTINPNNSSTITRGVYDVASAIGSGYVQESTLSKSSVNDLR